MKSWMKYWNEGTGLGSIAVATIIVIIVGLAYVAGGIWVYNQAIGPEAPQHQGPYPTQSNAVLHPDQSNDRIPGDTRFMGLPPAPDCAHLYNQPGKHMAWADCMGVGYDDSLTDELLYDDRDGPPPDCTKVPFRGVNREWKAHCMPSGRD